MCRFDVRQIKTFEFFKLEKIHHFRDQVFQSNFANKKYSQSVNISSKLLLILFKHMFFSVKYIYITQETNICHYISQSQLQRDILNQVYLSSNDRNLGMIHSKQYWIFKDLNSVTQTQIHYHKQLSN